MKKTYIIAEAGVNHNGNLKTALQMAEAAKRAGADAVKFQTFKAEDVISRYAPKAEYQKQTTNAGESQLFMVKKLELTHADHKEIQRLCNELGIDFLSTPFDLESIDFLTSLGLNKIKIPSGEITNYPYLVKAAKTGLPIILSTGMSGLKEIGAAIDILKTNGAADIALLHCNTEYPTPFKDANLNAIKTLRDAFNLPTGYSDHTPGIEAAIAAAALGAVIIEKHFTLDKTMEGPDHKASLEPDELKAMVFAIRNVDAAMGTGIKACSPSEKKNKDIARKSIVAKRAIKKGEPFTIDNITVKRPGTGVSPMRWEEVLGQLAPRNFEEDELIEL